MISLVHELPPALFGLCHRQIPHAHQIIGCCCERKKPFHLTSAAVAELVKTGHCLDPTEDIFYPLALALARSVPIMAACSPMDGWVHVAEALIQFFEALFNHGLNET